MRIESSMRRCPTAIACVCMSLKAWASPLLGSHPGYLVQRVMQSQPFARDLSIRGSQFRQALGHFNSPTSRMFLFCSSLDTLDPCRSQSSTALPPLAPAGVRIVGGSLPTRRMRAAHEGAAPDAARQPLCP